MPSIFRIYTENKFRREILELANESLQSFTVQDAVGYYAGQPEPSIILEMIDAEEAKVQSLAHKIRNITNQESVLLIKLSGKVQRIGKQGE